MRYSALLAARPYLVPQPLAGNDRHLITYPLVRLEVEGELGVVALDDDLGRLLDRLRPYATHVGGVVVVRKWWVEAIQCRIRDSSPHCQARRRK